MIKAIVTIHSFAYNTTLMAQQGPCFISLSGFWHKRAFFISLSKNVEKKIYVCMVVNKYIVRLYYYIF